MPSSVRFCLLLDRQGWIVPIVLPPPQNSTPTMLLTGVRHSQMSSVVWILMPRSQNCSVVPCVYRNPRLPDPLRVQMPSFNASYTHTSRFPWRTPSTNRPVDACLWQLSVNPNRVTPDTGSWPGPLTVTAVSTMSVEFRSRLDPPTIITRFGRYRLIGVWNQ